MVSLWKLLVSLNTGENQQDNHSFMKAVNAQGIYSSNETLLCCQLQAFIFSFSIFFFFPCAVPPERDVCQHAYLSEAINDKLAATEQIWSWSVGTVLSASEMCWCSSWIIKVRRSGIQRDGIFDTCKWEHPMQSCPTSRMTMSLICVQWKWSKDRHCEWILIRKLEFCWIKTKVALYMWLLHRAWYLFLVCFFF